ncbi:alpha/beta hydrolase [Companilactobacillus nodensis]|uniref:Lipase esterase n=1 Tax=Companilactobacillus nodensis DSM 19682 = JCM 14932 = NBRC 107160 TaxID=1423775 RepID=A0A0R1KCE8_9LACO|nr:alpha/beta hydrolase [Companilactobacillus nodensis]KRK81116.1 lipase esterase [Companilactobacillus nodensis DSM 19682 = JCM 14932 = NBRC 107160]
MLQKRINLKSESDVEFNVDIFFKKQFNENPDPRTWPLVLIFPGGGFVALEERESEPIAEAFLARGYQAAIINYPLMTNTSNTPFYPNGIIAGLEAIRYFKTNASKYNIDPQKIITLGFSAGGHVVALMNSLNASDIKDLGFDESIKANAQILGYPVVGLQMGFPKTIDDAKKISPNKKYWNANEQVTAKTPPTFIWHTMADKVVPVKNTLAYTYALSEAHVPFEYHVFNTFSEGIHGIGLASYATQRYQHEEDANNRVAVWLDLADSWIHKTLSL